MLVLLVLIAFVSFLFLFYRYLPNQKLLWPTSFCSAALFWGIALFIITETLSVFNAITALNIFWAWLIVIVITNIILFLPVFQQRTINVPSLPPLLFSQAVLLFSGLIIVFSVVTIAYIAPANTWDSMTYHMGRVAHWIQNQSITYYPTHIDRQLWKAPWAEMAIMHLQLFNGTDQWANLVQTFSMIGSALVIGFIVGQLGGNRFAQLLSGIIVLTIPVGILQGSSTQNDYVVAFWICIMVYFILRARKEFNGFNLFQVACSAGLAILTKETAYVFVVPFIGWLLFEYFQTDKKRAMIGALIMAVTILLFNATHYVRNQETFNSIISPKYVQSSMVNNAFNPRQFLIDAALNINLHLITPFAAINQITANAATSIGVWSKEPQHFVFNNPLHEDNSGNFLHLLLLIICMMIYIFSPNKETALNRFLLAVLGMALLFVLLISFNRFHARVHLPIFVLSAAFMAIVITKSPWKKLGIITAIVLLLASLPWVFYNESKPLLGDNSILKRSRTQQYFSNNPGYMFSYLSAIKKAVDVNCREIGLILDIDVWEYPLWAIIQQERYGKIRLEHINVGNASNRLAYPKGDFDPCAIINVNKQDPMAIPFKNKPFIKTNEYAFLTIYLRFDYLPKELQEIIIKQTKAP